MAEHPLMRFTQEGVERAIHRSRMKFQTDLQSNLATAEDNGIEKGLAIGRAEGRAEGMTDSIRILMDSMGWNMEQAMSVLKIPEEDRPRYIERLRTSSGHEIAGGDL